jgi:hypothetical protein
MAVVDKPLNDHNNDDNQAVCPCQLSILKKPQQFCSPLGLLL